MCVRKGLSCNLMARRGGFQNLLMVPSQKPWNRNKGWRERRERKQFGKCAHTERGTCGSVGRRSVGRVMAGECQLYHCVLLYSSRSNWQVIQEASPSFCLLLLRLPPPPPPPPPLSVPVPLFCSCCCCLLIFPIATVVVLSLPPRTALHFNPRGCTVLCCAVWCTILDSSSGDNWRAGGGREPSSSFVEPIFSVRTRFCPPFVSALHFTDVIRHLIVTWRDVNAGRSRS